ncbi:MAG: iron-containing alcohol dehydrogenase [Crocinitomicaceae bacterium]|nr:iron-containing alcohol dehydrogenase [Crocinitomicaceae bacterium]
MLNFEVVHPTRIVFGANQLDRLPEILKDLNAKTILLAFGGGSIKRIGLHARIIEQLKGFDIVEFGGIEANPEFNTLMDAVHLARDYKVDFILAVGGGSVIDGVKFISGAIPYDGDPWDVLERKTGCIFNETIPFGTVLTLPATGSEANSGAVISRHELCAKRTMGGPLFFPEFSFCDPSLVATLPKEQIANGVVDAYMHTLEQYLTYPSDNLLQEREAEAILKTLIEIKGVVDDPSNYKLAANLMWCATHALNGNLRCGVPTDWTTHMIGHELTALFGIDHARTLAIVAPRLYENRLAEKKEKLVQYGKRIWNLTGTEEEIAQGAITKTEDFFNSLGIKTRLSAYTDDYEGIDFRIKNIFEERGWVEMGERKSIQPDDIAQIIRATY